MECTCSPCAKGTSTTGGGVEWPARMGRQFDKWRRIALGMVGSGAEGVIGGGDIC